MTYFKDKGGDLVDLGYLIVPIKPGQKRPMGTEWQKQHIDRQQWAQMAANGSANAGVGILCGQGSVPITLMDIDCLDAEVSEAMTEWAIARWGYTVERVGKAPKMGLVYQAEMAGWTKQRTAWKDWDGTVHALEWLGSGQQFVAYGIHPDTEREYSQDGMAGALLDWQAADLPVVTADDIAAAMAEFDRLAEDAGWTRVGDRGRGVTVQGAVTAVSWEDEDGPVAAFEPPREYNLTVEELRERLTDLVAQRDDYDRWVDVGLALHRHFGGSDEGLDLWDEWSQDATKYLGRDDLAYKWVRMEPRPDGITVGSVIHWSNEVRAARHAARWASWGPRPVLALDDNGRPVRTTENLYDLMRHPGHTGIALAYDTFRDELVFAEEPGAWQPFSDHHYVFVQMAVERLRMRMGFDAIKTMVHYVARRNIIDTAQEWVKRLTWDGVPRVSTCLSKYFGTEEGPFAEAVSRYLWTAMAGRVLVPGIQADMMVTLVGIQGLRKTSVIRELTRFPESQFTELHLSSGDDALARKMRGTLICELAELKGVSGKDVQTFKAFVTRRFETWVPKYKEFTTTYGRRCLLIGTTNEDEFLDDPTGERRHLPLQTSGFSDPDGLRAARDQLWAEALVLFNKGGVAWQDAQRLAPAEIAKVKVSDLWEEHFERWLADSDEENGPARSEGHVSLSSVLSGAVYVPVKDQHRGQQLRAAKILKGMGYKGFSDGKHRFWKKEK